MAFLKQQTGTPSNDRGNLYWHRAEVDRAPFRGKSVPLLKEHEYEGRVERVWDCYCGTFDTSAPEQLVHGRTLQWIMDSAMAKWVTVIFREHSWGERDGSPIMFQYIEWAEPYQELPAGANGDAVHNYVNGG